MPREDCKIRTSQPSDRAAISSLSAQVFGIYGNYGEYLPAWAEMPEIVTLAAESAEELVGFLMVAIFEGREPPRKRYADILAIAVEPERQRQGIGRRLLASALLMLEEQRESLAISEVRLTVADTNNRAQAFFQSFGFEFTGECEGRYEGGQKALRMRRPV